MTDGASIGSVWIDVEPRSVDFWSKAVAQLRPGATQAGDTIGGAAGKGVQDKIAAGFTDGVSRGGRAAAASAARAGEDSGGKFADSFRRRVEAALKALPDAKIGADSSEADRAIADIRAELESLRDARIGVELSDADAVARIAELTARLDELAAKSPNIGVKVDAGAASAKLAEVTAEAEAVGAESPTIRVDVDSAGATAGLASVGSEASLSAGGMQVLISAAIALGPALIPAAAGAAAALGSLGAVAFAVGGAIAVVALAIAPVIKAVQAMGAAQTAAGNSAGSAAGKQMQMAGAIDQVRSAQAALANTEANAADSQRRAGEAVTNALRSETDANRQLAVAQAAVTQARIDAARAAEDLSSQVAHNALDQRQAALDLQKAQQALVAAKAGGTGAAVKSNRPTSGSQVGSPANTQAVAEAQLAVDEAVQRQKDLAVQQQRLTDDKTKSDRAGIDGSTQVVAAIDRVRQATEAVHKAEQATADARIAYASQERQNEFAIAQAKQGVVAAQRAVQQASVSAGTTGAAATNKLADAMAALSPAGQAFATFLFGLKPLLTDLSKAAQDGFLPGLQAGMQALLPVMPAFTDFIRRLAGVLGELARQALTALASPWWQSFFTQMADIAVPLLAQMGPLFLDVAKGFGGLFLAFAPLAPQIIGWLSGLATQFAAWATTLNTNSGFQAFIAYVNANGPLLVSLLGSLLVVTAKLVVALAPLGALILQGLTALAQFLAKLSPGQLIAIAAGIGLIVAAIILLVGGPVAAIVAAGVAIAGALVYAWTHCQTFRDITLAVLRDVAAVALWLWHNVIDPTFQGISTAIGIAAAIIRPILQIIGYVITQILVPAFLFFWHNVIEPAWQGIQVIISVAWAAIQVIFGLIQIALKVLGAEFRALYDVFIRPVWEGAILPLLRAFGSYMSDTVVPAWQRGMDALSRIFDGIRDKFKAPIRFVIQTVLNDGLLGAYNWIASRFGVKPDNVHVALPAGFASGGYIDGPGGPRDDMILARLSAGEYVIPAHIVNSLGVGFFDELIGRRGPQGVNYPGDGSAGVALPGFADGGLVGLLKSAWNTLTNPIQWIKDHIKGVVDGIPGAGALTGVVAGVGHKLIDGALSFAERAIGNLMSVDGQYMGPVLAGNATAALAFVKAQEGHPYLWAQASPRGSDCSGFVSMVYNFLHGRNPYSHTFSTMNEAPYFPIRGVGGLLTAGWTNPGEPGPGGDSVGHTAGLLATPGGGYPFESTGSRGMHSGSGVTPVTRFAHVGHFDSGGPLYPGLTIARNDTGRTEWVLTHDQMADLAAGRGRTPVTVNNYGAEHMSVGDFAKAVIHEINWQLSTT